MTQERRKTKEKDAIINNFMFQSAYLSRMNKKIEPGPQIVSNCFAFFFLSWNVTDYHETHKLNPFFFFFFHLSNNWFDISEHFKGSLARRLCSKLQYKAEDLPLAECQVYASASLPHPVRRRRRRLLASHPLPPLSLSFLPEPSESKLYTTCLHCPVCVCFSAPLCPGPASLL